MTDSDISDPQVDAFVKPFVRYNGQLKTFGQSPIQAVDYQPGDGWRYVVLVSDLPHDHFEGGGSNATHAVVSVWIPGDPFLPDGVARTYVMARTGYLTDRYVAEKFGTGVPSSRMLGHIANAIRVALGRPDLTAAVQ